MGHDHMEDEEERAMNGRVRRVMERLAGADIDLRDG